MGPNKKNYCQKHWPVIDEVLFLLFLFLMILPLTLIFHFGETTQSGCDSGVHICPIQSFTLHLAKGNGPAACPQLWNESESAAQALLNW